MYIQESGKKSRPSRLPWDKMNVLKDADIICFSHDWTGDPLSKTHIIRILARRNRILWVNALANRAPTASRKDLLRTLDKLKAFAIDRLFQAEPNIFVLNPLAFPSYGSETIRNINRIILQYQLKQAIKRLKFKNPINLIFNPAAGLLARKLGESLLVYYCVDEYSAFTGAVKGLKQIEEDLCKESDFVVVSAQKLLESKSKFNENTFLIRHGVDWNHFRQAINSAQLPEEIKNLPRPIIGFHGLLADWIDYELIKKIAEHFKGASIVLIGKVTIEAEALVENIKLHENIHLLGRKPYADLPIFCAGFDVAINPFIINELTLAANPLKVREYMAAGLQTVSTDIPEVRDFKYCLVARDHRDFIEKLDYALHHPVSREEISDSVKTESWDSKVVQLEKLLVKFL